MRTPDKVILKFGPEATGPQAMLGCSRQYWHDHMDSGAILEYAANGIVRLDDHGYFQKLPEFHNSFFAAPAGAEWLANSSGEWDRRRAKVGSFGPSDHQVRGLTGDRVAQIATLACDAPHAMPISQERTTILSRRGPMIVWDRIVAYSDGLVGSPLWHVERIHRSGKGWAETSIDRFVGANGPWMHNAPASTVIADLLADEPWEVATTENIDMNGPPVAGRFPPAATRAHITRTCIFRRHPLATGAPRHFITAIVPAEMVAAPEEATVLLAQPRPGEFVASVAGCLLAIDEPTTPLSGPWGESDANILWVESAGISAHRAKKLAIRRAGLPEIEIASDPMFCDLDLTIEDGIVRGLIATEKASTVRIAIGGKTHEIVTRGVTPVEFPI